MSAVNVFLLILVGGEPAGSPLTLVVSMFATMALVAAYVVAVLPRLNDGPAVLVSLLLGLVILGIGAAMSTLAGLAVPVLPAWGALLVGHLGLRAGRAGEPRPDTQASRAAAPAGSASAPTGRSPLSGTPRLSEAPALPPGSPASTATPLQAATLPSDTPDRTRLGRYRIDRQIGRGAMGAVYLGLDPKIGRPVAIKTMALAQEFDGAELADARDRFFREAETAGRLRHPDIVTIFDAGEDEDLAFIAMEFVAGHDLQRHTRLGTLLPVPQVLRVVERVAEALAHAHSQGVVHRDIKPANVMVDLDAPAGLAVKVTDFGIARVGDASRTRTGMVLGTPSFMSPEQMAGRRVDGRSDLYSLGVMLFQLLTGRLPHHAESMARLMSAIANERAPDVRSIRPELPEALAGIVALALEKRPEVRYGDGGQMAHDLRAVQLMYDPANGSPETGVAMSDTVHAVAGRTAAAPGPAAIPTPARFAAPDPDAGTRPPEADAPDAFAATVKFTRDDPGHNSRG